MSRRVDRLARDMAGQAARLRVPPSEPPPPFVGTILDAMDAAGLTGPSWAAWRAFWKAVFALSLDAAELAVFRRHTGRTAPPPAPVREAWQIVGRRGVGARMLARRARIRVRGLADDPRGLTLRVSVRLITGGA